MTFEPPREVRPAEADLYGLRPDQITMAGQGYALDHIPNEIEQEIADPLKPIAYKLRALPAELLWKMCDHMGQPAMAKILVNWAISYLDGTEMVKEERRG